MRPYLAVIADSFRAAFASRILWVAFLAIWIFLGVLAPIGYREDYTTSFRWFDFSNGTRLKALLAQGLVDPQAENNALGRLARAMPDDLQTQLRRVGEGNEVRIYLPVFSDALNDLLETDTWYDSDAWQSTLRLKELRDLDATPSDQLSPSLKKRRARLRIEAALPGVFHARSMRSISLRYGGFDLPKVMGNFSVGKTQFVTLVNQWIVPFIMEWMLGFVLIFVGILVTASIVPDMLQPGSLHLLLSKPVSRSWLLLSKFVGGCTFVFLCFVQLVVGLWLIIGLRLDMWNARILWCIPVSVFLFAVYYSVSVFAGLKWRSPVLAIGMTCMFGAICLTITFVGQNFDVFVTGQARIRDIVNVGETLIATTRGGGLVRFDQETQSWENLLDGDPSGRDFVLPPIRLDEQRVVTARIKGGRTNPYGSGSLDLWVLSEADNWQPTPSVRLPIATTRLASADDSLIALNTGGVMRTDRTTVLNEQGTESSTTANGDDTSGNREAGWLTELLRMQGGATADFQSILPTTLAVAAPMRIIASPDGLALYLFVHGRIVRLVPGPSGQPWKIVAEHTFEGDPARQATIAVSESLLMVSRPDEPIQFLNGETLAVVSTLAVPDDLLVVKAIGLGSHDRFVVLTSDGTGRVAEPIGQKKFAFVDELTTPDIETFTFEPRTNSLFIVHDIDSVDIMDGQSLKTRERLQPVLAGWRWLEHYVVAPLRTLTPRTGELGETVSALVGGKASLVVNQSDADEGDVIRFRILRPILSCGSFIVFMLTMSCLYFARKDF